MKKSQTVQLFLTVIFGPLGVLYSSPLAAIVMLLVTAALSIALPGVGLLVAWLVGIIVGAQVVSGHNAKVDLDEKRHNELLKAQRA